MLRAFNSSYNGYPGVLKNALDYLLPEYERKPIAIVTVSPVVSAALTV
jgi:NAD(P)H-dependent FMN reductase